MAEGACYHSPSAVPRAGRSVTRDSCVARRAVGRRRDRLQRPGARPGQVRSVRGGRGGDSGAARPGRAHCRRQPRGEGGGDHGRRCRPAATYATRTSRPGHYTEGCPYVVAGPQQSETNDRLLHSRWQRRRGDRALGRGQQARRGDAGSRGGRVAAASAPGILRLMAEPRDRESGLAGSVHTEQGELHTAGVKTRGRGQTEATPTDPDPGKLARRRRRHYLVKHGFGGR